MKKMILAMFSLLIFSQIAYSSPPVEVTTKYDPGSKMLDITVYHGAAEPAAHFIYKVIVSQYWHRPIVKGFQSQDNSESQKLSVSLNKFDIKKPIFIEAKCNYYGSFRKEITIK